MRITSDDAQKSRVVVPSFVVAAFASRMQCILLGRSRTVRGRKSDKIQHADVNNNCICSALRYMRGCISLLPVTCLFGCENAPSPAATGQGGESRQTSPPSTTHLTSIPLAAQPLMSSMPRRDNDGSRLFSSDLRCRHKWKSPRPPLLK